jgi:hypothetical protein
MMRNPDAKHVDFRDLIGVMGNILPSNIDMMIERNGYFIVGEWKREGEAISMGQKILLRQLATQSKFLVLVIQGSTNEGKMEVSKIWRMQGNGDLKVIGDSVDRLKDILRKWKEKVEQL